MVTVQFLEALKKRGVVPIGTENKTFDPAFHEAAGPVHAPGVPEGRIVTELLRGYVMKDLVIRPSRVLVSKAPESDPEEEGPPEAPGEGEEAAR